MPTRKRNCSLASPRRELAVSLRCWRLIYAEKVRFWFKFVNTSSSKISWKMSIRLSADTRQQRTMIGNIWAKTCSQWGKWRSLIQRSRRPTRPLQKSPSGNLTWKKAVMARSCFKGLLIPSRIAPTISKLAARLFLKVWRHEPRKGSNTGTKMN